MFFNPLLIVLFYFIFNSYFLKLWLFFLLLSGQRHFSIFFLPSQPPEEFLGFSLRNRPHPRPCPSQPRLLSYIPLAVYASRLFRNIKCSCPLAWWCFTQGPRYISSPVSAQAPRCLPRSQHWVPDSAGDVARLGAPCSWEPQWVVAWRRTCVTRCRCCSLWSLLGNQMEHPHEGSRSPLLWQGKVAGGTWSLSSLWKVLKRLIQSLLSLMAESWQSLNGSHRLILAIKLYTRVKVPSHKAGSFCQKGGRAVLCHSCCSLTHQHWAPTRKEGMVWGGTGSSCSHPTSSPPATAFFH